MDNNAGPSGDVHFIPPPDESPSYWAWATATWFTILALPLLLFPRFILFLAVPATDLPERLTPLEGFLCTNLGIGLFMLAVALITSIPSPRLIIATDSKHMLDPTPVHPLLVPLSLGLSVISFISYNSSRSLGALAVILSCGCGLTGAWGLWVIMFQGPKTISQKTGADKHTSSFMFGSRASASEQKKLWKKEREAELRARQAQVHDDGSIELKEIQDSKKVL